MSWEIRKFGDVVEFPPKVKLEKKEQYSFIPMDEVEAGRKYVGPKYLKEWKGSGGARFKEGDTLFARITPCLQNGKIAQAKGLINGKGFGSTEFFIFRGIEGVTDTDFVYYLSINSEFTEYAIGSMVGASGRQRADTKFVGEYELNLPPLQTQKRIADILSAYDDLIENNLKRIKLLEQAAQNIYKEWFVNQRFPGYEKTPINEETGLPVGWGNSELDSVATVQSSKRVFLADYVDNGVPFYRGKEISQKVKHEAVSEPYFISHEKFREFDSGFGSPKENDILITAVGTIGNCYLVRNSDLPFYFKDGNLLWIHSYNENVSGFYLIQYFQSPIFKEILNSITIGSSQKALTITAVKKLNITVPNNEILEKFDSIIKPTMKQIEVLAKTMIRLKAARDILLPRLMNRTIEV
jgi:type I restriction enzyme S subunit